MTEIHRALDILRKEGASSGDVDNMLEELEDKIIQEEMFPFLREAVGPALSPLRHRLSLVVDYMPGAPLNIRIDKNFTPDVLPADVQERHEDEGMDGNEDLDVSGIFMCEKCAQEEGRGKVPVAMEDMMIIIVSRLGKKTGSWYWICRRCTEWRKPIIRIPFPLRSEPSWSFRRISS